jgi:hypothetical protein
MDKIRMWVSSALPLPACKSILGTKNFGTRSQEEGRRSRPAGGGLGQPRRGGASRLHAGTEHHPLTLATFRPRFAFIQFTRAWFL